MLKSIHILKWGTEMVIDASLDWVAPETTQIQLVFKSVQRILWDTMENEYDERDVSADVIGFDLHDKGSVLQAVIHTDIFEIIIDYRQLVIHKDW